MTDTGHNISDKNRVPAQAPAFADAADILLDQAMAWLSREGIDVPGHPNHDAFQTWCAQSPVHQAAAHKVQSFLGDAAFNETLQQLERDAPARHVDHTDHKARPVRFRLIPSFGRGWPLRPFIASLLGAGFAGCLAMILIFVVLPVERAGAPVEIAAGTDAAITRTLPDGSVISLSRGARLSWHFSAAERSINLEAGAVVIEAAHDSARPMVVSTRQSLVTVVGTRFVVIHDQDASDIAVAQGLVRVAQRQAAPGQEQGQEVLLHPGEGVNISDDGTLRRREMDAGNLDQVLQGWRVFAPARLRDVVAAVERQTGRDIWLDPRIANMEIRGRFNVANADATLALIAKTAGLSLLDLPFGEQVLYRS